MLAANRLDGLIADELSGVIELQQMGLSASVVRSNVVVSDEAAMVAFSKQTNTTTLVTRFNKAFESLLVDGRYKTLFEAHVPCRVSVETLGCK